MQLDDWFEHARRDAVRRGLPDLEPLLDMLFRATRALREADWARSGETGTAGKTGTDAAGGDAAGEDTGMVRGRVHPPPPPRGRDR